MMLNSIDKRAFRGILIFSAIFFIIGVSIILASGKRTLSNIGKKENIKDAEISKIQNTKLATIEVDKYNLYDIFGVDGGNEKYGIIIAGNSSDSKFMAVKVDDKYISKLNKIKQENDELNNGNDSDEKTTVKVSGRLVEMSIKEKEAYEKSIYDKWGYEKETLQYVAMNLYVDGTDYSSSKRWFAAGIIVSFIAAVVMILDITKLLKIKKAA